MKRYVFLPIFIAVLMGCSKAEFINLLQTPFAVDYNQQFLHALYSNEIFIDPWVQKPYIVKVAHEVDKEKMFSKKTKALVLAAAKENPARVTFPLKVAEGILEFDVASIGKGRLSVFLLSDEETIQIGEYSPSALPFRKIHHILDERTSDAQLVFEFRSDSPKPAFCFIANAHLHQKNNTREKPNVVFISVDSLRADAVRSIIPRFNLTPSIDALALEGVAFTRHFVVSNWTRPSTMSMLASVYGSSTGVNLYYFQVSNQEQQYFYTHSGAVPLPVLLKQHGYITRSIGNNAFILHHSGIGVDLGFDDLSEYQRQWEDTIDIAHEAMQWIADNSSKPFFLFINFNAPHNAYIPPEQYLAPLRKTIHGVHPWFRRYLGEVAYTDDYIGRIVATLKKHGIYDNTIIVVTSDHGEVFNEAHSHSPYTGRKAIFSHGQTLYDEELHIPLIIKLPKNFMQKPLSIPYQSSIIDIAPTLCDLLGIDTPARYQGKSLMPFITGHEKKDRPLYSEGRLMYAVRYNNYKYIEKFHGFGVKPHHWGGQYVEEFRELYNVYNDPDELHNIVEVEKDTALKMQKKLYGLRFRQPEHVLYANKDVSGTIAVKEGFFYTAESEGSYTKLNRQAYRFNLKKGQRFSFSTIPGHTSYYITSDNAVVLLGYSGIKLPKRDNVFIFDSANPLSQITPDMRAIGMFPHALIVWSNQEMGGIQKVTEHAPLSDEMHNLLTQWGYIQDGGAQ